MPRFGRMVEIEMGGDLAAHRNRFLKYRRDAVSQRINRK
jgi:hypothetical protein